MRTEVLVTNKLGKIRMCLAFETGLYINICIDVVQNLFMRLLPEEHIEVQIFCMHVASNLTD